MMGKILYLGLNSKNLKRDQEIVHYPIIKIIPRDPFHFCVKTAFDELPQYTHLIFTSQVGVDLFFHALEKLEWPLQILQKKKLISVGKSTARRLEERGFTSSIPQEETQEGIIKLLHMLDLEDAYLFCPRSALSRNKLSSFLCMREIRHQICDLYDTVMQKLEPVPKLEDFDEVIFTSPSTVNAFLKIYKALPRDKKLTSIGRITQTALEKVY